MDDEIQQKQIKQLKLKSVDYGPYSLFTRDDLDDVQIKNKHEECVENKCAIAISYVICIIIVVILFVLAMLCFTFRMYIFYLIGQLVDKQYDIFTQYIEYHYNVTLSNR